MMLSPVGLEGVGFGIIAFLIRLVGPYLIFFIFNIYYLQKKGGWCISKILTSAMFVIFIHFVTNSIFAIERVRFKERSRKNEIESIRVRNESEEIKANSAKILGYSWLEESEKLVATVKIRFFKDRKYTYRLHTVHGVLGYTIPLTDYTEIEPGLAVRNLSAEFSDENFTISTTDHNGGKPGEIDPLLCVELFTSTIQFDVPRGVIIFSANRFNKETNECGTLQNAKGIYEEKETQAGSDEPSPMNLITF